MEENSESDQIDVLSRAAEEIVGFMKAFQASPSFHEKRVNLYSEIMKHYFKNCDPDKLVKDSPKSHNVFDVESFNPKCESKSNYDYKIIETVSFPPLNVRFSILIWREGSQAGEKKNFEVAFELVNLRPYQDTAGEDFLRLHGNAHRVKAEQKALIKNVMIISWDTEYRDVFIQLLLFAVKSSFLTDSRQASLYFYNYVKKMRPISFTKNSNLKKEIAADAFSHVVRHYAYPTQERSFKKYICLIVAATKKKHNLQRFRSSKPYDQTPVDNGRAQDLSICDPDNYLIFRDDKRGVTYGIDRVAIDTGISRDTIYRYIRCGKIRPIRVHNGKETYLTLNEKTISALENGIVIRKELIKLIAGRRSIKKDSARKRILRLTAKGIALKQIYELHK